jgi:hypothetical protein
LLQNLYYAQNPLAAAHHFAFGGEHTTQICAMAWFRQFLCQPDGKSFFVTNRQIRFAEAWTDSQTMSYDLTAGIIEINDQDKSKSTGVLYPLAEVRHEMVVKLPKSFKISLGCCEVCTTSLFPNPRLQTQGLSRLCHQKSRNSAVP